MDSQFSLQEIQTNILYANTSVKIWANIKEQFSQSNDPKIYQLK